jgi:hypothetical protein
MSTTAVLDPASAWECKPFTATLWLFWIAVAVLDESLHGAALVRDARLLAHENTVDDAFAAGLQLVELYALIVPITATAQWLVLRRAVPRLSGGLWLAAAGIGAVATFLILLATASLERGPPALMLSCVASTAAVASIVSLFALGPGVGRWPTAFVVSSILASIATAPLYAAAEFPMQVLPSQWVASDAEAMLATKVLLRLAAGALGGAITGTGLSLLCRPTMRI